MLVQKGARLANPAQAEDLQRILESTEAPAVQNESNGE
jgi:hypothetical protein